jgi:fructose-bisphosphate aldolase / 6-deoxy-5-ketofructose 1-phosphate synthase
MLTAFFTLHHRRMNMVNANGEIKIPLDVPSESHDLYRKNYLRITHGKNRLMLFAGDQKAEHLNNDFYGPGISPEDNDPEHLFRIASGARIGVFASQLGLISKYGMDYPHIPYLVKLNSKSNLVKTLQAEPFSQQWIEVEQVVEVRDNSDISINAVGYTVYPGSEYEYEMLQQAAQIVNTAHFYGLPTVLWMYPRGKAVSDEKSPHLIAGAAGMAACLGSDFVKVNAPKKEGEDSSESLKEAVQAAGRTRLVCAGGEAIDEEQFLMNLYKQIHIGGASGNATGRNIHQKPLKEAINFCNAIYAITVENAEVEDALKILRKREGNK